MFVLVGQLLALATPNMLLGQLLCAALNQVSEDKPNLAASSGRLSCCWMGRVTRRVTRLLTQSHCMHRV